MVTKGYGLTIDNIDWSCPADLEPYAKAHNLEVIEQDNLMWAWWGNYGLSAVSVAIERNFAGQKAKSEYIKNSVLQKHMQESNNGNKEAHEECAVFEMKQRINLLRQQGLPESPV